MIGLIKGTARQIKTVSGLPLPIASYKSNSRLPIQELSLSINPTQSGSGDPAPDNIRPITGVSSVNVTRCGVNVWDEQWETGDINNTNGEPQSSNVYFRSKNFCKVCPSTKYTINLNTTRVYWYDENKNYISSVSPTGDNYTTTSPSNAMFFKLKRYSTNGTYNVNISVNSPYTATDYHAYTGNTYTIDLDGTRYGGELDVTNGVLRVTHAYGVLSDYTWNRNATYNVYYTYITGKAKGYTNIISDSYKTVSKHYSELKNGEISGTDLINGVNIKDDAFSDVTSFINARGNVGICYELATPFTVNLDSLSIPSLLGSNNIWHDGNGDVEALKFMDRQLYFGR